MPASHLEHLSDLPPGQVDIEPAHELVDLLNAQQAIPILVSLLEGLLHPCAIRSRSVFSFSGLGGFQPGLPPSMDTSLFQAPSAQPRSRHASQS